MNRFRFKEVSVVPQYAMSALNPIRRIGQMVGDLLESRGVRYDDTAAELTRRLDLVGLSTEVLQRYPIELSGGMKQRMVIVLSTLLNPSLLIADEVTSALDVSTQRAVATTLVEFRDRGFVTSMIVITHDVSLVYQIADTIMVMYAGRLAEKASADAIVKAPRHPYTKLLISSLPEVGVRYDGHAAPGHPGQPAVAARSRHRAAASGTAAHSPSPECEKEPPLVEVAPGSLRRLLEGRLMLRCDAVDETLQARRLRQDREGRRARRVVRAPTGRGGVAHRRERERQDHRRQDGASLCSMASERHRSPSTATDISTLRGKRTAAVLPPRAGRVPGPVQLLQPGVPGRPRVRRWSRTSTSVGAVTEWTAAGGIVARGRAARPAAGARQVPAPASAAASSNGC